VLSLQSFEALAHRLEQVTIGEMVILLRQFSNSARLLIATDFELNAVQPKSSSMSIFKSDDEDGVESLNLDCAFASIFQADFFDASNLEIEQERHRRSFRNVLKNEKFLLKCYAHTCPLVTF
jgi:hypothetical protein